MSEFSVKHIKELMAKTSNIRNVSIIGNIGHGKSTLLEMLMASSTTSTFEVDDTERTYRASTKSTLFTMSRTLKGLDMIDKPDENCFLLNFLDTPGHLDFLPEVTVAIRVTDGVLVVLDTVEGVCLQTDIVLRQAIGEGLKPLIVFSGIDRALLEYDFTMEDLYESFLEGVRTINSIISLHSIKSFEDFRVNPYQGTVAFASGFHGWAFTIPQFAQRYATKFGVDKARIAKRLWGDNYFNSETKKWTTENTYNGQPLVRAFNQFILDPIFKLFSAITSYKKADIINLLDRLQIRLSPEDLHLEGRALLKVVMKTFLPADDAILESVILHLPSPSTAQDYRTKCLYEGLPSDEVCIGLRKCDPTAPLLIYISKMIPTSQKGQFYAFGRVFAGTVRSDMRVRIQGTEYIPGSRKGSFLGGIEQLVIMTGDQATPIDEVPAGNLLGLVGIDQFLLKSGTISACDTAYNLKIMKFTASPTVQCSVEVENAQELPKLVQGLKELSKANPSTLTYITDSGAHIIAGTGPLHIESCLADLKNNIDVALSTSELTVSHRETVTTKSSRVALSKSPNKYNRLFMTAEPLNEEFCQDVEVGVFSPELHLKARAEVLSNKYGFDAAAARKIWCFGPEKIGANILIDQTKSVQFLHEIRDSAVAGFQWASREGPIAEEAMRSCRFNIMDVALLSDAIHRGGGQVIPATRRVVYAAALLANPALLEPVSLFEVTKIPAGCTNAVQDLLLSRGGQVVDEEKRSTTFRIRGYIPVQRSFGLAMDLRQVTANRSIAQFAFDHWATVGSGSPLDPASPAGEIVQKIRKRKGIQVEVPDVKQVSF